MKFQEAQADVQSIIDSMEAVKGQHFTDVAKILAGTGPMISGVDLVAQGVLPPSMVTNGLKLLIAAATAKLCDAYNLDPQEITDASKVIANKMHQRSKDIDE